MRPTCKIPTGRRYPTNFWGPQLWRSMHLASFQYIANDKNRAAWRSFLQFWVPSALPCAKCRAHYLRRLPKFNFPVILRSRASLVLFLHGLHNAINADVARKLGKPYRALPFAAFCNMYKRHLKK